MFWIIVGTMVYVASLFLIPAIICKIQLNNENKKEKLSKIMLENKNLSDKLNYEIESKENIKKSYDELLSKTSIMANVSWGDSINSHVIKDYCYDKIKNVLILYGNPEKGTITYHNISGFEISKQLFDVIVKVTVEK